MDVKISNVYNAYNIYNNNIGNVKTDKAGNAAKKDSFSISAQAEEYQMARKALANTPDVREDKITQLSAQVSANNYNVDANAIAESILMGWNI
jgi:negative regulator of flagellin synthesis FlgM